MDHHYAVADDNGQIVELNLGPVKVKWVTGVDDRIAINISSGSKSVSVYSSPTGRSLRVFGGGKELEVIAGLKIRKLGAAGRAFSAGDPKRGTKISAVAEEHGYHVKLSVDLNYNMMTERQGQKAHDLLYAALTEALTYAQEQRKANVPIFSLQELEDAQSTPEDTTEGINEL